MRFFKYLFPFAIAAGLALVSCDKDPQEGSGIHTKPVDGDETVTPSTQEKSGFAMMDLEGNDHSTELLPAEEGLMIVTIHHIEKVNDKGVRQVRLATRIAEENGLQIILLTSALPEEVQAWLYENQLDGLDFLFSDATAIETMMRGNPGFMFIKDATVVDKTRKVSNLKIEN